MIVLHTTVFSGLGKGGGGPVNVISNLVQENRNGEFTYVLLYSFSTNKDTVKFQKSKLFSLVNYIRSKVKILESGILLLLIIKYYFKLKSTLKTKNIDIIHFHDVLSAYVFSILRQRKKTPKTLLTIQSVGPFYNEFPLFSGERFSQKIIKKMEEKALQKVNMIVYPSNGAKLHYLKFIDSPIKKIIQNKIFIVPNAINPNTLIQNHPLRKPILMKPEDYNILTVARLHFSKGIDQLPLIAKKLPMFKFYLIGNGSLKNALLKKISDYKINNLILIDKLEHGSLLEIIKMADLFLMVSRSTVFDLVMLEVMSLGKIILATDIKGHDEMIHNGVNGFLTDINSIPRMIRKISELSKFERNKIIKDAKKTVQINFSPQSVMKNYEKLYRNLIA